MFVLHVNKGVPLENKGIARLLLRKNKRACPTYQVCIGRESVPTVTMLKDEWFICLWDDNSAINDIMVKINRAPKKLRDPKIIKELQNPNSEWMDRNGMIFKKGSHKNPRKEQQYVPRMEKECEEIMEIYHSWGHPGIEKT